MVAWREANKEKLTAYYAAYRQEHKEKRDAYNVAYYEAHKEERDAYNVAYRQEHKEERAAYTVARWLQISREFARMLVYLRDGPGAWCYICRTEEGPFHIDHNHTTGQIRGIVCAMCNLNVLPGVESPHLKSALEYLQQNEANL